MITAAIFEADDFEEEVLLFDGCVMVCVLCKRSDILKSTVSYKYVNGSPLVE